MGTECFAVGSSWFLEIPKFSTSFLKSHTHRHTHALEMGCSVLASMGSMTMPYAVDSRLD